MDFWEGTGAGDVLWAQDANETAIRAYQLRTLGTEVIVDREGAIAFRSENHQVFVWKITQPISGYTYEVDWAW